MSSGKEVKGKTYRKMVENWRFHQAKFSLTNVETILEQPRCLVWTLVYEKLVRLSTGKCMLGKISIDFYPEPVVVPILTSCQVNVFK